MRMGCGETNEYSRTPRVLAVDHPVIYSLCRRVLARAGIDVIQANNPLEAIALLEQYAGSAPNGSGIGVVMTGNQMRPMRGSQILGIVAEKYPEITRVMMSGTQLPEGLRAHYTLSKPFNLSKLVMTVEAGIGEYLLRCEQG